MKDGKSITTVRKKRQAASKQSVRDVFTVICKTDLKVECVKEFKFHPVRKWRFDYAIPEHKIALEVEGGVWSGGRHTSPKGFLGDIEKYNTATLMGWRVFRTTPEDLYKTATIKLIKTAISGEFSPEKAPFLP
jgi:very-short-patch-repair endonuclease